MDMIIFKNMETSDFARSLVRARLDKIRLKIPSLVSTEIRVTLERQAGPDKFTLGIQLQMKGIPKIQMRKSAPDLYQVIIRGHDSFDEILLRQFSNAGTFIK